MAKFPSIRWKSKLSTTANHILVPQAMRLAIEFDGSVKDTTGLEGMLHCQGLCLLDDR